MFVSFKWTILFLLLTCIVKSMGDQRPAPTGVNACIIKQTCHECIQTVGCVWCAKPDFKSERCFLPHVNQKISEECPDDFKINPDNEYITIRNKELWKGSYTIEPGYIEGSEWNAGGEHSSSGGFNIHGESGSSFSGNSRGEAVQLQPQEVKIKLRINEVQKIRIQYAQAEDYPVDLYYLMDLSNSMKDDKQKLSDLGQLLVESMSNITSNFRLGFGSFVDKVVMPYVSIVPKALEEPCDGCAAPYGYRNHLCLSTNTNEFIKQVRDAPVSGNLDAPEGGFDAIMQAIVCRDEIGWRDKARKLLLFSTDAGFHFAGDGKLSGIVKPNDGCCHLENGEYQQSKYQDYPSISQINLKVKENSVNIIWAVTEEQLSIYQSLTQHIEGSYAAKLSEDSSNIVDLVREQYNAISSTIELKDTASSFVNIKYYSTCLGGGDLVETNKCQGIKVGNQVEFVTEISVPACPKDRSQWNQNFTIYPVGVNESLTVHLEMLCDCECQTVSTSPVCHFNGDLKCGICICNEGFFGEFCQCDSNENGVYVYNEYACKRDNTSQTICSGRGTCECNTCICTPPKEPYQKITGKYCECDNFSCDHGNNTICSGHGECNCGECNCFKGWTGSACDCSTDTGTCWYKGQICSGRGKCDCGKCICEEVKDRRYYGKYCQKCEDCPNECEVIKPCVLCNVFHELNNQTVDSTEECKKNLTCDNYEIVVVKELIIEVDREDIDMVSCWGYDMNDCKYYFAYFFNETIGKTQVNVLKARDCPPQVYLMGIILGVVGAVVVIGVAFLLTWKLFTSIADRREFAKFEKERMMARWDASENPIYRQATSTFKNPTYSASAAYAASASAGVRERMPLNR
ncbi:integrin beta-PS-like isoform X2 [Phymastichus coffea]|nr:integrin beta-PS-like isoform X2 [Phymastichus coffea]